MIANKQKIVDEIILEIEAGKGYSETLAVNGSKWQLPERTFGRYWSDAKELYLTILDKRRELFENKTNQMYFEGIEKGIMSKAEKLNILQDIIRGETKSKKHFLLNGFLEEKDISPNLSERMKAIEIHNKMQGDFITEKIKPEPVRRRYILLDGSEDDDNEEDDDNQ